jgi:peptide/nickel transport system permease protein
MFPFLLRRILLTIPVLLGVATLVFSLIHLVPGDPVQAMLGESASPQDVAEIRGRLGLDRPLYVQYGAFLKGLATGDLGRSLRTNQSVTAAIGERLPATFELAFAAMVVATLIAIPLGIVAAVRAGTHVDHAATTLALLGI